MTTASTSLTSASSDRVPASTSGWRLARRATAIVGAVGAACVGYGLLEARSYRLRRVEVPVLAPGSAPLRILHVSDLHMTPEDVRKQAWVRALDSLDPDLVVATGDNLSSPGAVPGTLVALGPLLERPGAFVLGSNDYYAPHPANPLRYLLGPSKEDEDPTDLPWRELVGAMTTAGWADLTNARATLDVGGRRVDLVGVDDPHLRRDRYHRLAKPREAAADLSLGVAHAPYKRVLDAMTRDGLDLLLAGHTHGGQLRVPGFGALVTNCDLPRRYARGLFRWTTSKRTSWVNVSAGLGTSPFAPVRFACPPEATLLTLVARD